MRIEIGEPGLYEITWPDGTKQHARLEEGDVVEAERVTMTFYSAEDFIIRHESSSFKKASASLRNRDRALVTLCADKLSERGHHHAANSLRKMLKEGQIF